ncbi:hypothetical protein CGSHiAA_01419, partial [Haemophilus influenzae PittAA]
SENHQIIDGFLNVLKIKDRKNKKKSAGKILRIFYFIYVNIY